MERGGGRWRRLRAILTGRLRRRFGGIRRIGFGCITGGKSRGSKKGELGFREMIQEAIQKRNLSLLQFHTSLRNREEADFIDFGEALEFAGTDRPLGGEGVAGMDVAGGQVAFASPSVDGLAAFLKDGAEIDERAGGNEARFFAEFALGGDEQIFAFVRFALGDGPMAVVFLREEMSAGMCEEDFGRAVAKAVEEEASGDARSACAHATDVSVRGLRRSLLAES